MSSCCDIFLFIHFFSFIHFISFHFLTHAEMSLRNWTKENFLTRCSDFTWNDPDKHSIAILPVVHGTSITIAWKVCHGGMYSWRWAWFG
jgi:hypothetical protein